MLNEKQKESIKKIGKSDLILQCVITVVGYSVFIVYIVWMWRTCNRNDISVALMITFGMLLLLSFHAYNSYQSYKVLRDGDVAEGVGDFLNPADKISGFVYDASSSYLSGASEIVRRSSERTTSNTKESVDRIALAKKMLRDGLATDQIAGYTGLSIKEIESLKN